MKDEQKIEVSSGRPSKKRSQKEVEKEDVNEIEESKEGIEKSSSQIQRCSKYAVPEIVSQAL